MVEIGDCRLYLADCLEVLPTLAAVDHVFTDPPYSSGGLMRGDRMSRTSEKYQSSEHRGIYAEFTGDNRDQRSFAYWASLWLGAALRKTRVGGLIAMFSDWRQLPTLTDALQSGGWIWRGVAVWDKTESARPQRGRYRNQCEYIIWGSAGPMRESGPCAPGVFRCSVTSEQKHHITGKPVSVIAEMLQLTDAGDVVLDPFMGSGTTGVACARLGRKFIGIELDPEYFDIACRRIDEAYRQPRLFDEPVAPAHQESLL